MPSDFVYLKDVDKSIIQEMRYAKDHNFVGRPIVGYNAQECLLTKQAAIQLSKIQQELLQSNMSLKVYDCYRPQKAVNEFIKWSEDKNQMEMKEEFYPTLPKDQLFNLGFIAKKSGHTRGSTVDLTIVGLPVQKQPEYKKGEKLYHCFNEKENRFQDNSLDFGTGYDCFNEKSHTMNQSISQLQKQNRKLLVSIMEKYNFKYDVEEWWHYTLKNEPFPNTYFNFNINKK